MIRRADPANHVHIVREEAARITLGGEYQSEGKTAVVLGFPRDMVTGRQLVLYAEESGDTWVCSRAAFAARFGQAR